MEVISSIYNSGYNIKKFYLGSRELNLAYLGNQVIYDEVIGDNDLNYILYEFYGSDTLPNTVEAPVKSAILKGNTIKYYKNNLFDNILEKGGLRAETGELYDLNLRSYRSANFIPINGTFKIAKYGIYGDLHVCFYDSSKNFLSSKTYVIKQAFEGNETITPPTNTSFIKFYNPYDNNEPTGEFRFGVMAENEIIELGLQFVKMPVLRTSNNGCYIINIEKNCYYTAGAGKFTYSANFDTYNVYVHGLSAVKLTSDTELSDMSFWGDNNQYISGGGSFQYTFSVPSNAKYFKVAIQHGNTSLTVNGFDIINDYKSNILSVSEDVELRGIGDVKDELDCLTGEVIERIGEIVLDGSEDWISAATSGAVRFSISLENSMTDRKRSPIISDYFPYASSGHAYPSAFVFGNSLFVYLEKTTTLEKLKTWLGINKPSVQYQLATESIKTVDLTIVDQDGKTINKLNSFNGTTHISTEVAENSAYPMVSLEVASELQAAMSKVTEDIELIKPVQNDIETTIDTQSNDIDSLLLATTELFEMFL